MGFPTKKIVKWGGLALILSLTVLLLFSYLYYARLKHDFLGRISAKATSFAGQNVDIGDIFISPAGKIVLYNVTVHNPNGFEKGELLRVERISMDSIFGDLLRAELNFSRIVIQSPKLSLMTNKEGRLNLSDELVRLFTAKERRFSYRIDEFRIDAGIFDFNGAPKYRNEKIDVVLKNLSSEEKARTEIKISSRYYGNKVSIEGWAFPNEEAKRLHLSLLADKILLRRLPLPEKIPLDKRATASLSLGIKGDMNRGYQLSMEAVARKAEMTILRKTSGEVKANGKGILSIPGRSLTLSNFSLNAAGITSVTGEGQISQRGEKFPYHASVRLRNLDLSSLAFMEKALLTGIISSGPIIVTGTDLKAATNITGDVFLQEVAYLSKDDEIRQINGSVKFSSRKALEAEIRARAKVAMVRGYRLNRPADAILSANLRQQSGRLRFDSSVSLDSVQGTGNAADMAVKRLNVAIKGNKGRDVLNGVMRFDADEARLKDYEIKGLAAATRFDYRNGTFTAIAPVLQAAGMRASAKSAAVVLPGKKADTALSIGLTDLKVNMQKEKILVDNVSADFKVALQEKSGAGSFSIGTFRTAGLDVRSIQGSGRFDKAAFLVDISKAAIGGGSAIVKMRGKTGGNPFPVKITAHVTNVDLGLISSVITASSYGIGGVLQSAVFEGALRSQDSIEGNASLTMTNIGLRDGKSGRDILKDGDVKSSMVFRGRDIELEAELGTGKLRATATGTIGNFLREDRTVAISLQLPGTKLADIREIFWDVFPDSLLYTGMEGAVSSNLLMGYSEKKTTVRGAVTLDGITITGENGQYSIGPVKGSLPIDYSPDGTIEAVDFLLFEPAAFKEAARHYSNGMPLEGYGHITIDSLRYGFDIVKSIDIYARQKGNSFAVKHFSGNIFGGRMDGAAVLNFSKGIEYRTGFILKGLSLARLCDEIETIKGYLSGKVDGVGLLKGSGTGTEGLVGKADFWSYSTKDEKARISRTFLQKVGGISARMYLRDRPFDKGIMSLYLQNGFVVFRELEISNRNILGIQDLSIKVAPFNNRIALDHLMWSLTEAAQRAEEKQ